MQAGQTSSSFLFQPPGNGTFTVMVTVTDGTSLVNPAMAGNSMFSSRQWTATVSGAAGVIFSDGFETGTLSAWQH